MSALWVLVNVVLFLLILSGLYWMNKKHISFSTRVFVALGAGIAVGFSLQSVYGSDSEILNASIDWLSIVGSGFVKLLQMVVMPLVFLSILSAFTKLKLASNTGKISMLIIAILVGTTAIAAAIGIASALGFHLEAVQIDKGDMEITRGKELEQRFAEIQDLTFPQKILELLPDNPFLDFTGARPTSTIAVVIFAAIIGIAYLGIKRKHPAHVDLFTNMVDAFHSIIMRVVTLILRLTPYGVFAMMTKAVATTNVTSILKLGKFVMASYVALILMFLVHLLFLTIAGFNPITYVKKVLPVLTFAFTSRTSAGTLPLNVDVQMNKLGVPEGIANLAGSFGLSIGQNGCAGIYPAMLAVMIAPTTGIDPFNPSFIVTLIAGGHQFVWCGWRGRRSDVRRTFGTLHHAFACRFGRFAHFR